METLRGFKLFRQDPEWLSKLLVMAVLLMIPTVGQIVVIGWGALFLRGVLKGREPGWSPPLRFDFDYLVKLADPGFKAWIVRVGWSLPIVFLMMTVFGCIWGITIVGVATAGAAAEQSGHGNAMGGLLSCLIPVMYLILIPLLVVARVPSMMATIRVEVSNELKDGFNFGEVMKMSRVMFKETIIGLLILSLVSFPLVLVGYLACFVGLFVVIYILTFVGTHFQAQLYQRYLEKGGTPLPIASDEIVMPAPPAAAPVG